MSDPREDAAKLIPVVERAEKAERMVWLATDALRKTVAAYDQFLDVTTVQPLVKAIKNARDTLDILEHHPVNQGKGPPS